jgi:peptidoglycan-N-acetylglucosamine deacetylase
MAGCSPNSTPKLLAGRRYSDEIEDGVRFFSFLPDNLSFLMTIPVAAAAGAAVISAGAMAYAVRAPWCTWLAPSVSRGTATRPSIALTFDDGPSESTMALLEVLARHRALATFFQCGANVRRLPGVAREVIAAGHEIGNHTDTHQILSLKSSDFIHHELTAAQSAIEEATGVRPRYFRAPYGVRWFGLRSAQRRLALEGVMWSAAALDWKLPASEVVSRLLARATPGAIFCLHDGRGIAHRPNIDATLEAVSELLPRLVDRGFQFETMSQIVRPSVQQV